MKIEASVDLDDLYDRDYESSIANIIRDEILNAVRSEVKKVVKENQAKFAASVAKVVRVMDQKIIEDTAIRLLRESLPR